ncbi:MAG: ACP phosphodiesterase [Verrucomicrobiota bacterium JB023]|nr:ACP phosphodiesterase [Verrucomicrobiota bacterium JB023]
MNFLAHLALAGPEDASRIGNLLGDFEKGTAAHLALRFPPEVVKGIIMHRHLDAFTDSHPAFVAARQLLKPERRRFGGILVDIFFDHFLALHWAKFHPGTVPAFIEEIHEVFDRHPNWLGDHLGPLMPRFKGENWLASYATPEGLEKTLERVSYRSPRLAPLAFAVPDLLASFDEFRRLFMEFYPDARCRARQLLEEDGMNSPTGPGFP